MKGNYLGQAWLVLLLALVFGSALAGVHVGLGPIIEGNKKSEALSQIPELVGETDPPATPEWTEEILLNEGTPSEKLVYKAIGQADDGESVHVGWVIRGKGSGYADAIEVLIGLNPPADRVTGIYVLSQNETPNLGHKIVTADFRDQFAGKSTLEPIGVVKQAPDAGEQDIVALSGATISSDSVATIVNDAVAEFRANLDELAEQED